MPSRHCRRSSACQLRVARSFGISCVLHLPCQQPDLSIDNQPVGQQFILFGANDAALKRSVNNQHVPLARFKENLTRIISHPNIKAHDPKIFLVTPPPLDQMRMEAVDLAGGYSGVSRLAKTNAAYSQAVRDIAAEQPGVTLIDLWKAIMDTAVAKTPGYDSKGPALGDPEGGVRGYLEHLLPDGLHMSAEAYQIFYDIVRPHLGSEWAGTPEEDKVGYLWPDWRAAPWLEEDVQIAS